VQNEQTEPDCVQRHADALEKLKAYSGYVMLPSHGPELCGSDIILRDINNRLCYYNAILNARREITYEEAARGCERQFLHSEWHADVYG
jgi:hypothetical protein